MMNHMPLSKKCLHDEAGKKTVLTGVMIRLTNNCPDDLVCSFITLLIFFVDFCSINVINTKEMQECTE